MAGCLSENNLAQFVEGQLSAEAAVALQAHTEVCPSCLELLLLALPAAPGQPGAELPELTGYPSRIDEYVVLQPLGHGAMGQVFLAHDTLLDRDVAIKFLAEIEPDQASRERFQIEARAIARLQHPNVVTIHRVAEFHGVPYLISELIRGESLDKWHKPLPWPQVLRIGIGLARGLAAAHRRGVLHRDIKPSNIMMSEEGEAKLLDFGLAKLLDNGAERAVGTSLSGVALKNFALTGTETRVGTPLYMPPEVWRGELATKRSDVYSLGVVLYELCIGRVPLTQVPAAGVTIARATQKEATLRGLDVDERLAALIDRCLQREPAARFASADALREALESVSAPGHNTQLPPGSPYRGLQCFDAEHAALFFGRGAEVRAVLDRLRGQRFVLVTADSGVGKSSLCRAGVLPAAQAGLMTDGQRYTVMRLTLGRHPLHALAGVLANLCGQEESAVLARLREDPVAVARALRTALTMVRRTLIFVDQLEELFILATPAEIVDTAECLAALLLHGGELRLLATLRSDFLTRVAALPALGDEIAQALYLLKPLSDEGIYEAIVGPARSKGFHFESEEMVRQLMGTVSRAPGGLPLLAFTLDSLWELRDKEQRVIPEAALARLGGVAGALANHADGVLLRMTPGQRQHVRRIFHALVSAQGTRLRRSEAEILAPAPGDPAATQALRQLLHARLLTARTDEHGAGSAYEIAHEALISGWQTLRSWLIQDADQRLLIERLTAAAREWQRMGGTADGLWGRRQLAEIQELKSDALTPADAQFLATSRRRVRRVRLLGILFAVSMPALLVVVYGGVWIRQRHERAVQVEQNFQAARRSFHAAASAHQEFEQLRARALPKYTQGQRAKGDAEWQQALTYAEQADEHYALAGQSLENALMIDSGRQDVRGFLADVLYQQALVAERTYQGRHSTQLLRRLSVHDKGGTLLKRWHAAGQVSVRSDPPSTIVLEQYNNEPGRLPRVLRRDELTPLLLPALAPGSYRLTFWVPGRPSVRYPFMIERGEALQIHVPIPHQDEIPVDFVYVPAGRFLFGSDAEESQRRRWFNTAPLHQENIGAFLIARYETTFSQWLTFLQALPSAERAKYLVQTASSGHGAQGLTQLADGRFALSFKPSSVAYQAVEGERVRYLGRNHRSEQDWRRFPVTGVSALQAVAYADWLRRSGRLPTARLCTEFEWERAARGADDREYSHGDQLEPDDANFDETYNKEPRSFGPDEVGSHPASRSPFDVEDLIGNAFEWVQSPLAAHGYAIRGGSYYYGRLTGRIPNRTEPELAMQNPTQGFRICASTYTK